MGFNNTNWIAPPLEQLNFSTNCTLFARWTQTWYSSDYGVLDLITADYFRSALPQSLQNSPTNGQIIDWYHALLKGSHDNYAGNGETPFFEYTLDRPRLLCKREYCTSFRRGAPEVAGVGVCKNISLCLYHSLLSCSLDFSQLLCSGISLHYVLDTGSDAS